MNHKSQKREKEGKLDTYFLLCKFQGHSTWRVVMTNRDFAKLEDMFRNLPKTLKEHKIMKLEGLTGKIKLIREGKNESL